MPIDITHSVIHGFDKEQHSAVITSITKRNVVLDVGQAPLINLIEGISTLLGRRKNAQSWGRFDSPVRAGPYRQKLLEHSADSSDADGFLRMTHSAMDEIIAKAALKPASTGSHILFAQFKDEGGPERILVAMIKQKGGIQLDSNFVPVGIVEVDMSKLSQAADIRIQEFVDNPGTESDDAEEDPVNYLSFLSQRDSEDAASYFVEALGCIMGISSKHATSSVRKALDSFIESKEDLKPYKKDAREKLCGYLAQQNEAGLAATISGIAHTIRSVFPPALADQADDLDDFLNGQEFKIPPEFFVHANELKKYSKVNLEADDMKLRFNRSIVGKSVDARVYYNKSEKTLTISNLSTKMIDQLDKDLAD